VREEEGREERREGGMIGNRHQGNHARTLGLNTRARRHADRQTDRQTDKQTDRQTDRQTDTNTNRHTWGNPAAYGEA